MQENKIKKLMQDVIDAEYANGNIDDINAAMEQVNKIIEDMSVSQRQRMSNSLPIKILKRLLGNNV